MDSLVLVGQINVGEEKIWNQNQPEERWAPSDYTSLDTSTTVIAAECGSLIMVLKIQDH